VLSEFQDARSRTMLSKAYEELQTRAASISEPGARQKFFENVPHNREVMTLWDALNDA
jgi:hypothetical protein